MYKPTCKSTQFQKSWQTNLWISGHLLLQLFSEESIEQIETICRLEFDLPRHGRIPVLFMQLHRMLSCLVLEIV